jgi:glucose-6-phosphate isomerase
VSLLANRHAEWEQLASLSGQMPHLRDLFASDEHRYSRYKHQACGIHADFSKQRINDEVLITLQALLVKQGFAQRRDALLSGAIVNDTESRPAWHTALRCPAGKPSARPAAVIAEVESTQARMFGIATSLRQGEWLGHTDRPITDVVNIGIGGSDLGGAFLVQALAPFATDAKVRVHFVANVDGRQLYDVLTPLHPATTAFVIVSKTFTTIETLQNARSARAWLQAGGVDHTKMARHLLAVSARPDRALAFGIPQAQVLPFADWVGGRYSVWGPVGLSVAIAVGARHFADLLAGAHAMDEHFAQAPVASNLPVLMGLIGAWNINFLNQTVLSIAPYHQRLARFPAYLQQLEMESNGKSTTRLGEALDYASAPVVFGEPGTNGQHAYFQMLHQGTQIVPTDFIAVIDDDVGMPEHHAALLGNCIAQSRALAFGRPPPAGDPQAAHRAFAGNRPSTTLLLDVLTPNSLGALVALYEHKVFVQSVLWGINAFDQWGVELGKELAHVIAQGGIDPATLDSSSAGLLRAALPAALHP